MKLNLNRDTAALLIQIKEQTGVGFCSIMAEALQLYYKQNVVNKQHPNNEVYDDRNNSTTKQPT